MFIAAIISAWSSLLTQVGGVVKRSVFNVYPSAAPPHPRDSYIQSKHVRTRLELKFQSEPTDVVSQNRSKLEQQNIWIGGAAAVRVARHAFVGKI
jgi:hypothetical protein